MIESHTKVKIIADSKNPYNKKRITTFEVTFPRIILAEFNTHRMISKNFSSSRAIPFSKMVENTEEEMFIPPKFGLNKSGMSSDEYLEDYKYYCAKNLWVYAYNAGKDHAERLFNSLNVHKQWCNRLIEPFQYVKGICTSTDYDNFFYLRIDEECAQPEIVELATKMREAYLRSEPRSLKENEWHIPYFKLDRKTGLYTCTLTKEQHSLENAQKIAVSLCAQRSYRKEDASLEKADHIYDRLFNNGKPHCSPLEHCATPIYMENGFDQQGVTHQYKDGVYASGNLVGWVQLRQLYSFSDKCNHTTFNRSE